MVLTNEFRHRLSGKQVKQRIGKAAKCYGLRQNEERGWEAMRKTVQKRTAAVLAAVMFSGVISQGVWADNHRQQAVRPPIIEPVMKNTTIVNGAFEKSVDGFGNPEGWNIRVSKNSGPGGSVSYSLSKEEDNTDNTSKKLTLYNGMDEDISFSVTQTVYASSYASGNYVASVIYEGSWNEEDSGIVFRVNEKSTGFGMLEGWQKWKQAVIPDLSIVQGQNIEISISGRLRAKEFLDLDDVELVEADQFAARAFLALEKEREHPPYEPVRTAPAFAVQEFIQNGTFDEDICWDVYGYPQGYLPKWEISAEDLSKWDYWIADGVLECKNISETGGEQSMTISQKVHLKPGKYLMHGETGWVWDEGNEDGVCMRVEDKRGVLIAERYWNPGYGRIISDEFMVKEEMDVTASVTLKLPQGANAAMDGIEITESPKKVKWNAAKQVGGVSEKEDTEKIRVTFSAPVFGLEEKHFLVDDAIVTKVTRDGNSAYLLHLEDVAFANDKEIEVRMIEPEYYDVDTKKKKVKVYRDAEAISGSWNGGFDQGVDWGREDYPDGYIAGWELPKGIDWEVWRYNVIDGVFQVSNISENGAKKEFKLHQVVSLPKGTYSIKTNSPWTRDEGNADGILLQVKEKKKILAQVSGCPGAGVIQSDTFTLEEDTVVDCIISLSVPGGKDAALKYISLEPTETISWKSVRQMGGEPESRTTEAVELVFDQDIAGLAAEHFQTEGAEIAGLQSLGGGKYRLELNKLSVPDGEQIMVNIDAPNNYLVRPTYYPVTVYRESGTEYSTELVNGDFSTEVDWSNPLYPDGYVEGWQLPDPIDWATWRYYARNGVFGVVNNGADEASFEIGQEIILPAGEYVLEAESPWADGDTKHSRVKLLAEGEEKVFAQAEAQPGMGVFGTDKFTLDKPTKVTVKVQMTAAPGCEINIDNIVFSKPGAELKKVTWESAVQSGGKDEMAESTGIILKFSQDVDGLSADHLSVTGAEKGGLSAEGDGKYLLEIYGIEVKNGEEVTVKIQAPEGFQITPASRKVTVYQEVIQDEEEFEDPIVNGSFLDGVDWDNGGSLKGWTIDSVDWDVWDSYSGNGGEWGNFWVIRKNQDSDVPLSLYQEVELKKGVYTLEANSQGTWDEALTDAVSLYAEADGEIIALKEVQPGYGSFITDEFTLEEDSLVKITVSFKLPASAEAGIDDVKLAKVGEADEVKVRKTDSAMIMKVLQGSVSDENQGEVEEKGTEETEVKETQEKEEEKAETEEKETQEEEAKEKEAEEKEAEKAETQEKETQEEEAKEKETKEKEAEKAEIEEKETQEEEAKEKETEEKEAEKAETQEKVPEELEFDRKVPEELESDGKAPEEMESEGKATEELESEGKVPEELESDGKAPEELESEGKSPEELEPEKKESQEIKPEEKKEGKEGKEAEEGEEGHKPCTSPNLPAAILEGQGLELKREKEGNA